MKQHSFAPLFITNFFGVINDNYLKTLAMFLVIRWLPEGPARYLCIGVMAGALVLPYILLSPLADRLMLHFSKKNIFLAAKWAELPIMGLAIAGFSRHSIPLISIAVFFMGAQSSLYSPAKYALIRDIGGPERVSVGMGGMDGLAFLAMLAGTVLASFLTDHAGPSVYYACLLLFAGLGLLMCYTIRAEEERETTVYPVNPFTFLWQVGHRAAAYPGLNAIILMAGVFWWTAAMMQMGLVTYGKEVLKQDSFHTGLILSLAAVGITTGNILAGFVDRKTRLFNWIPITGGIAAGLLAIMYFYPPDPAAFCLILACFSFEIGFFKLPLDAEIQKLVKGPMLNTILSYFNQVTFIFILIASGCYSVVSACFGSAAFLLFAAIVILASAVCFEISRKHG